MYRGQIVELTTSDELYANPFIHIRNHYYQRFHLHPDYERNRKRIVYDPSQHNYGSEAPTQCVKFARTFRTMFEAEYKKYKEMKYWKKSHSSVMEGWLFYYIKELYICRSVDILKNRRYKSHVSLVISICKITELEQKHSPLVLQV